MTLRERGGVAGSKDLELPRVREAELLMSAPLIERLVPNTPFEIAILGRSNVGKSSFINRICNKRHLARTSATPGRTQHVVLFSVELIRPDTKGPDTTVTLADLPGYGYAKVSKSERAALGALIDTYLQERAEVELVCVLNDCRRDPEDEELSVQEYAAERGIPFLVVLTKADKLSRSELAKRTRAVSAGYHLEPADVLVTGDGMSVRAFWERAMLLYDARDVT